MVSIGKTEARSTRITRNELKLTSTFVLASCEFVDRLSFSAAHRNQAQHREPFDSFPFHTISYLFSASGGQLTAPNWPTYVYLFESKVGSLLAMIQAVNNQRVVFKPEKLLSPSAIPYRESTQKIPWMGEIECREYFGGFLGIHNRWEQG